MNKTIFFSWQSDIERNKKIIQNRLKEAVKELKSRTDYKFYYSPDESTKEKAGAVNIETILFEKIRNCDIFIADISIINFSETDDKFRFTPNPNVLIELGYAAASIGWGRIITITDSSNASIKHLPFDIKQHRTIQFNFESDDPAILVKRLIDAISRIEKEEVSNQRIRGFINRKIDHMFLFIYGYFERLFNSEELEPYRDFRTRVVNMNKKKIEKILLESHIHGFYAYRAYSILIKDIEDLLSNSIFVNNLSRKSTAILIKLALELEKFNLGNRSRFSKIRGVSNREIYSGNIEVKNIEGTNNKQLIQRFGNGFSILADGEFKYYYHDHELLRKVRFNKNRINGTVNIIFEINELYKEWMRDIGEKI